MTTPTYAVNLYDLQDLQKNDPVGALLFPPSCLGNPIIAERKKPHGDALILNVPNERATAILQIIRTKYPKKYQFRIYHSKTGRAGWRRI